MQYSKVLKSRDDWIRTSDPYVPNVVRYRAALHPVNILMLKASFFTVVLDVHIGLHNIKLNNRFAKIKIKSQILNRG